MVKRELSKYICFAVLWTGVFAFIGCGGGVDVLQPADLDAKAVGKQALVQYDSNKDARIDATELNASPGLLDALTMTDQNKDKILTAEEIAERVKFHIDRKVSLLPVAYEIHFNGRPLQGATVTLVPEEFFQDGIPAATGVSNENGFVELTMPFDQEYEHHATLQGVRPGIYRIEISKNGPTGKEMIPAKYNTKSTLGREVGVGPHQHGPVISTTRKLMLSSR